MRPSLQAFDTPPRNIPTARCIALSGARCRQSPFAYPLLLFHIVSKVRNSALEALPCGAPNLRTLYALTRRRAVIFHSSHHHYIRLVFFLQEFAAMQKCQFHLCKRCTFRFCCRKRSFSASSSRIGKLPFCQNIKERRFSPASAAFRPPCSIQASRRRSCKSRCPRYCCALHPNRQTTWRSRRETFATSSSQRSAPRSSVFEHRTGVTFSNIKKYKEKHRPYGRCLKMEARGVEPLSENRSCLLSPSAVIALTFPPPNCQ